MRISRSTAPPRRLGRGFSVRASTWLAAIAMASIVSASIPASAATVTVKFGVSAVTYAPTGALCKVKVQAGAPGLAVFEAAKAKHCIVSYKAKYFPGLGHYIACINGLCSIERPVFLTYWAMFENGQLTPYGVDGFSANAGDQLVFVYTR